MSKKKIFISVTIFFSTFILAIVLNFVYFSFWVYTGKIDAFIEQIPTEERNLPLRLIELWDKGDTFAGPFMVNFRRKIISEDLREKNLERLANEWVWNLMLPIYLSKSNEIAVKAKFAPFGDGNGLAFGAQKYFSKSINELTDDEIITLLAIESNPDLFPDKDPTNFKKRFEKLKGQILSK